MSLRSKDVTYPSLLSTSEGIHYFSLPPLYAVVKVRGDRGLSPCSDLSFLQ